MLTIGDFARLGQVSPRMLRHYDELGLLCPEKVDPATNYRYYAANQLARLHRLLALRDLGFTLDQIGDFLGDDPPLEQLRGMLRMRQALIEQNVVEEQARLRRVEAHLRTLEKRDAMHLQDVVIKRTQPIRVAEVTGTAPGFGHENLGPVFGRLIPEVLDYLKERKLRPGIMVAHYEGPSDDGSVVLHAGFDIGDAHPLGHGNVHVVDLPSIAVAAVVHRGPMDTVASVYDALAQWIEDSGHRLVGASRELYHVWHDGDPESCVTELQMPIGP